MSTSKVRAEIQRQPETVIPLPEAMFGASAAAPGGLAASATTTSRSTATSGARRFLVDISRLLPSDVTPVYITYRTIGVHDRAGTRPRPAPEGSPRPHPRAG